MRVEFADANTADGVARMKAVDKRARATETNLRKLSKLHEAAIHGVYAAEIALDVSERWLPDDARYHAAELLRQNRDFIRVVDRLEALVVARLCELDKANLAGTGESFQSRFT